MIEMESLVIDEEKFLLGVIENRTKREKKAVMMDSIPTAALREEVREDDNSSEEQSEQMYPPDSSLSKTSLWKPDRSWWEAKSRKNPWLDPENHNKRWW